MRGSADVVDLCTPPPSPANDPENASVQQPPPAKRRATGASTAPSNRKARVTESVEPASAAVVDSDDDVMEVEAPVRKVVSHESQAGGDEPTKENEDDEVSFIGRSGELALSDFPHSRENCVCAPWRAGKEQKHCQNCFCYVMRPSPIARNGRLTARRRMRTQRGARCGRMPRSTGSVRSNGSSASGSL